ncbi:hypothetical protein DesLBE_5057 [Desulfitobacterium sp. LBE]|uniref:AbrB family transcriptional regulator n=2 Tax=root TaxID=1 RepID=A0A098B3S6_DESHA|nr:MULTISPECIES: hypothetical protein [Desulfitobacterium]MEA5023288.1 hypothetical protein [Desulfitobacterium hafniense]TWH60612.1 hypothetical protein DesLBE_5057 [Desulfitobacterium sp. LBE]CDX02521.1 Hypothetical protein DPCES_2634 [Desulfitobacterium hafniense]
METEKKVITNPGGEYSVVLIPNDMIESLKEKFGNDVLWIYDEESQELTLIKKPQSYTDALSGLGAEMWKQGGTEFIRREREQWDD